MADTRWPRFRNYDVITISTGNNRAPNIYPEFHCQSLSAFELMENGEREWVGQQKKKENVGLDRITS